MQFQHRLCHVHRIQVLSSAKTCEIYNQNEGAADSEYLCTVRGQYEAATKVVAAELGKEFSATQLFSEDDFQSPSYIQGEEVPEAGLEEAELRTETPLLAESENVAAVDSSSTLTVSHHRKTEGEVAVCEGVDMPVLENNLETGNCQEELEVSQDPNVQHGSYFSCETDEEERSCSEDSTDWAEGLTHLRKPHSQEIDEIQPEGCKLEFYPVDSVDGSHGQQELPESHLAEVDNEPRDKVVSLIRDDKGVVQEEGFDSITKPLQDIKTPVVNSRGGEQSEVVQVPLMEVRDGEVNGEDWTDGELEFVDSSDGLVNNCKDAGDEQEIFVKNKEKHDVNSSLVMNSDRVLPGRVLYRVEVEFEDPDPCISLTIRLLSLEEKFVVDIEDIVITVSSGPVLTALNSSTSLNSKVQGLIGGKEAGLLGMLVPSMLQMVQGLSGSNKWKEGTQAASVSRNNLVTEAASMQSMLTPSREPLMHALMARLESGGSKGKVADPPAVEVTRDASIAEVCERLDRLEGLCMRIETSLCKALESFDRRIELLESRQNWEAQLPHASPVVYESRGGPEAEVPISSSHAALTSVQSCPLFKGAFSSTAENISPFPGTATSVAPSTPSTSLAKAQSLSPPSPISSACTCIVLPTLASTQLPTTLPNLAASHVSSVLLESHKTQFTLSAGSAESSASSDADKLLDRSAGAIEADESVSCHFPEEVHSDDGKNSATLASPKLDSYAVTSSKPTLSVDDAWSSALKAFSMHAGSNPGSIRLNTDQSDEVFNSNILISEVSAGTTEKPASCSDLKPHEGEDVSSVKVSLSQSAAAIVQGASIDPVGRKEEDVDADQLVKVVSQPEETPLGSGYELETQQQEEWLTHQEDIGAGQEEEILLRPIEVPINYGFEDHLAQMCGSAMRGKVPLVQKKEAPTVSNLYQFFGGSSSSGSKSALAFDLNSLYEEQEEDCRPHSRQADFKSGNLNISNSCGRRQEHGRLSTPAGSSERSEPLMPSRPSQKWAGQQQLGPSLEDLFTTFPGNPVMEIGDHQTNGSLFSRSSSHREELASSNEINVCEQYWESETITGLCHQQQFMDLVVEGIESRTAKPSSGGFEEAFATFFGNSPLSESSESSRSGEGAQTWSIHLESDEFLRQRHSSMQTDLFEAFSQRDALEEEEGDTGLLLDDMAFFSLVTSQLSPGVTSSATSVQLMTGGGSGIDPFKDLFVDEAARPSLPSNDDLFMSLSSEISRANTEPRISLPSVSSSDPFKHLSANQGMISMTYDAPRSYLHTEDFLSLHSPVVPQAAAVAQGLQLELSNLPELVWDNDSYGSGSPSITHAPESQYTGDVSSDMSFEEDTTSRFCSLEPPVSSVPAAAELQGMGQVNHPERGDMIWYS